METLIAIGFMFKTLTDFLPMTDRFLVETMNEQYEVNAVLVDEGISIRLPDTEFSLGSHVVGKESIAKMRGVAELLNINKVKAKYLYIEGHTDSSGDESYNYRLGLKRADSVAIILKDNGIDADRVKIKSFGPSMPISTNPDLNRRVQILIYNP